MTKHKFVLMMVVFLVIVAACFKVGLIKVSFVPATTTSGEEVPPGHHMETVTKDDIIADMSIGFGPDDRVDHFVRVVTYKLDGQPIRTVLVVEDADQNQLWNTDPFNGLLKGFYYDKGNQRVYFRITENGDDAILVDLIAGVWKYDHYDFSRKPESTLEALPT